MKRLNTPESVAAAWRLAKRGLSAEKIYFQVEGITYEQCKIVAFQAAQAFKRDAADGTIRDAGADGEGWINGQDKDAPRSETRDAAEDHDPGGRVTNDDTQRRERDAVAILVIGGSYYDAMQFSRLAYDQVKSAWDRHMAGKAKRS